MRARSPRALALAWLLVCDLAGAEPRILTHTDGIVGSWFPTSTSALKFSISNPSTDVSEEANSITATTNQCGGASNRNLLGDQLLQVCPTSSFGVRIPSVTLTATNLASNPDVRLAFLYSSTGSTSSAVSVVIKAQKNSPAAAFQSSIVPQNIRSTAGRTFTTATVTWNLGTYSDGDYVVTPDLRTVVSEVLSDASWSSGSPIVFFFDTSTNTGTGSRSFRARTASNGAVLMGAVQVPALVVDSGGLHAPSPSPAPVSSPSSPGQCNIPSSYVSGGSCQGWCNQHTCSESACVGCAVCNTIASGGQCEGWCNDYSARPFLL